MRLYQSFEQFLSSKLIATSPPTKHSLVGGYLLIVLACIFSFNNSDAFHTLSSYALDEPHVLGPAWQAAHDKALFIRCSDNYAASVSACSGYSGLVDAMFIRVVSFVTGETTIISDPEFVNPTLQRALILKRGTFVIALLLLSYRVLATVLGAPYLLALVFAGLVFTPEFLIRGFEINTNGEMGVAIFFAFCLLLRNILDQSKTKAWEGIVGAISSTIKLPVLLFTAPILNNLKATILFIAIFLALTAGLLRNSFEFSIPLQIFNTRKVEMCLPGSGLTWLELVTLNLKNVAHQYFKLLPLSCIGVGILIVASSRQKYDLMRLAWVLMMCFVFLKSPNAQPRYYIGLTGIFFILTTLPVIVLFRSTSKKWLQFLISLLFTCLLLERGWPVIQHSLGVNRNNLLLTEHILSDGEQKLLDLLKNNRVLYVDSRIRLNTEAYPFRAFYERGRLHVVDYLNDYDSIPVGSTVAALCLPELASREFGINGISLNLQASIKTQCGAGPRFTLNAYTRLQNDRIVPLNINRGATAKVFEVTKILDGNPAYLSCQPLQSGQSTVKSLPLVTYEKLGRDILPLRVNKYSQLKLPFNLLKTSRPFLQEWESSISFTPSLFHQSGFIAQKSMYFERGRYRLTINAKSNFRNDSSNLHIVIDDSTVGHCSLNTALHIPTTGIPSFLKPLYLDWRSKYFPINCSFSVHMTEGHHILSFLPKTQELAHALRFETLEIRAENGSNRKTK